MADCPKAEYRPKNQSEPGSKPKKLRKANGRAGQNKAMLEGALQFVAQEQAKIDVPAAAEDQEAKIKELTGKLSLAENLIDGYVDELADFNKTKNDIEESALKEMKFLVTPGRINWLGVFFLILSSVSFVCAWSVFAQIGLIRVPYVISVYQNSELINVGFGFGHLPPVWAIYPTIVGSLLALAAIVYSPFTRFGSWSPEVYQYLRLYEHDNVDRRADVIAVQEVSHPARYAWFNFRKGGHSDRFLVSVELLFQLLHMSNVDPTSDEKIVWERMNMTGKKIQSINVDKRLPANGFQNQHVAANTVRVAYAAYQQMMRVDSKARTLGRYLPFRPNPAT